MIKDHRPYYIKAAYLKFQSVYAAHFLKPHFKSLGHGFTFMQPWNVRLFGGPIEMGRYANVIATSDNKVRFSVWPEKKNMGRIKIGDYCLICPGVRIGAANSVVIGDNCMIASNVDITDSDWHDIYNRISPGVSSPVTIEDNVWIGYGAIICKGVSIGANSVIGAGSVVTGSVPPDTVAAGNPARALKTFDPDVKISKRDALFSDHPNFDKKMDMLDREMLQGNTLSGWLRHLFFPKKGD